MDYATIRQTVNQLVDMLLDEGVSAEDILERLDLGEYGLAYFDLNWLNDYRKE